MSVEGRVARVRDARRVHYRIAPVSRVSRIMPDGHPDPRAVSTPVGLRGSPTPPDMLVEAVCNKQAER